MELALENPSNPPAALSRRPELTQEQAWLIDSFLLLSSARGEGYSGPAPINFGEIKSMISILEIQGVNRKLEFARIIRELDEAYLEKVAKK